MTVNPDALLIVNVSIADEVVLTTTVFSDEEAQAWRSMVDKGSTLIDVSELPLHPAAGSLWDGVKFSELSTYKIAAGKVTVAFLAGDECVMVRDFDPATSSHIIAIYRSLPTFEIVYDAAK